MTLSIPYKTLVLLVCTIATGMGFVQAQTEIEPSVESFAVGQLIDGEAITLSTDSHVQGWLAERIAPDIASPDAPLEGFSGGLVTHPRAGWIYEARWSQGDEAIVARFALIPQGETLHILEVGQYQTCICHGCDQVWFSPDGLGCECEEGNTCSFSIGERLH